MKGIKATQCLRVTQPWKLEQKSPMGKDILLNPFFPPFFKIKFKRMTGAWGKVLFVSQGRDTYEDICFKELLQK